jgi:hypothetical protein
LTSSRPGPIAAILNAPVSWFRQRPAFSRLVLLLIAVALLIVGLAIGDSEEILFKGSIL